MCYKTSARWRHSVARAVWNGKGRGGGVKHWSENTAPDSKSAASSQCSCQYTQTKMAKSTVLTSSRSLDTRAQWKAAETEWSIPRKISHPHKAGLTQSRYNGQYLLQLRQQLDRVGHFWWRNCEVEVKVAAACFTKPINSARYLVPHD